MQRTIFILFFCLCGALSLQAQDAPHDSYISVQFKLHTFSGKTYNTTFDLDSTSIAGMKKAALESHFSNISSPVHVLNFIAANGFDLVTLMPVQSGSGMGNSSGFVGFVAFYKKHRE